MYEVRKVEWIRDGIDDCKKQIISLKDTGNNADEIYRLIHHIQDGISLLYEGDITKDLSDSEKEDLKEYIKKMTQFCLSAKCYINMK